MLRKETTEKYLKIIHNLTQREQPVRACEIAEEMQLSRPTVCVMLRKLEDDGYIEYTGERFVVLTARGAEIAGHAAERFRLIRSLLLRLDISPQTAEQDAERLGSAMSAESYERIRAYYMKLSGGNAD